MFGMSGTEMIIILVLALLLFGPNRLPEIARMLGGQSESALAHARTLLGSPPQAAAAAGKAARA